MSVCQKGHCYKDVCVVVVMAFLKQNGPFNTISCV